MVLVVSKFHFCIKVEIPQNIAIAGQGIFDDV